jgi:hypothetical protein
MNSFAHTNDRRGKRPGASLQKDRTKRKSPALNIEDGAGLS